VTTGPGGRVTVLVVDDNDVIRSGLRSLLETCEDVLVVGEAADGDQAVRLIRELRPDVTLLDVRMPRRDGVSVAAEVSSLTRVLMLTYGDAPDVVRAALAAGAAGYLVHGTFRAGQLVGSVLAVAAGASVFSEVATDVLRTAVRSAAEPVSRVPPAAGLSPREVEVMELIAAGLTNAEISGAASCPRRRSRTTSTTSSPSWPCARVPRRSRPGWAPPRRRLGPRPPDDREQLGHGMGPRALPALSAVRSVCRAGRGGPPTPATGRHVTSEHQGDLR
jgi:DNA-binding NarL/FixJ family response regulator